MFIAFSFSSLTSLYVIGWRGKWYLFYGLIYCIFLAKLQPAESQVKILEVEIAKRLHFIIIAIVFTSIVLWLYGI